MGKSRRKFIKKEKAKVKLKSSKTVLPKGQNLTDTNFKVKKIVIKDQVKPHEKGELLSTTKLNVQDLLSRLGHHNVNMRKEALEGLTELISSHSEQILHSYLSVLLKNVTKSILDFVGLIRKDAIRLLSNIFSKTQCQQLEPFFPSMSSYLICGLTHIDYGIRVDSLYLLDIFLKHVPKLCANSAPKILPVCLDLISHKGSDNRTLSLNLDSSWTSKKWRQKVLSRIRILLTALNDSRVTGTCDEMRQQNGGDLQNKKAHFPYFLNIEAYICSTLQLDCMSQNYLRTDYFSIKSFGDAVIPLLLDMFVETIPQTEENVGASPDNSTIIAADDSEILKNIVDIIQLLWNNIAKEENASEKLSNLTKDHGRAVISKLIVGKFPYAASSQLNNKKKSVSTAESGFDISCKLQNLNLCMLVILFGDYSVWHYVIPYLKNIFRMADILNNQECITFTSCISNICQNRQFEDSKYFVNQASKSALTSKGLLANNLFVFLSDIALDRRFEDYHNETNFKSWLESLPKKLTKSKISAQVLEKICQISIRNYKSYTESLDALIESMLDNIPRIQVDGMEKERASIKIASLLYYVKEWDQEFIDELNIAIEKNYWGPTVTSYIQDIQKLKMKSLNITRKMVEESDAIMEV
ncbi:testis-expressed protein 10 [Rhodnius prolixus]|uniref:testis-expressed protein 10 n=1 Tax=Rhodnius prolixus TaxID=13249 RepID=UPI003D18DE28